jgi:Domain of unknown function (DUF5666)
MENLNLGPAEQGAAPAAPGRSGRTRRIAATIAASAALLGSGAGIGIALTGGASASAGASASTDASASAGLSAAGTASSTAAVKCATIAARLRVSRRPPAAMRLHALCTEPLLRLALVGGEYGQVTFKGKTSPKTVAFERGTVESLTGSAFTVKAPDGTTWTWTLTPSTTIHAAGQDTAQAKLASGDRVFVGGPVVGGARDARLIRIGRLRATGG